MLLVDRQVVEAQLGPGLLELGQNVGRSSSDDPPISESDVSGTQDFDVEG